MIACTALVGALKGMTIAATVLVSGVCPPNLYIHAAPDGVVLDFAGAAPLRLDLDGVAGITVKNFTSSGAATSALNVIGSSRVGIASVHCISPGTLCVGVSLSDQVDVGQVWVTGSHGDGIDVAGSTHVTVHDGGCEGNVVTPMHPDCVQLWSLPGHPVEHVTVQRMTAIGATQGYDLWDHSNLGASDIRFLDNTAAISNNANCIGVLNTAGLVISGNRCITLPGGAPTVGPARISARFSPGAVVADNAP